MAGGGGAVQLGRSRKKKPNGLLGRFRAVWYGFPHRFCSVFITAGGSWFLLLLLLRVENRNMMMMMIIIIGRLVSSRAEVTPLPNTPHSPQNLPVMFVR